MIDEKDGNHSSFDVTWEETEAMLDEIKFNITLVSLLLAVINDLFRMWRKPKGILSLFLKKRQVRN